MPADISANPNPVFVSIWTMSQQKPTTITWDTGDPAVEGTVWITDDAGTRKFVDRSGKAAVGVTGSARWPIGLGQQVLFALKRTDNPAIDLDTVLVVGREQLGLPVGVVDAIKNRLPLYQGITNLRVFPAIESVRIMFKTRQPTVPFIDIKYAATQALAGAAFPFVQGASQTHDYAFPLPQNEDFAFHILAPTAPGSLSNKAAEVTGLFRTGNRQAQVFFDHIFVHTDGDPGSLGDGDFTFYMGAGDTDSQQMLGATRYRDDISGGDDRAINQSIAIDNAPVGLWVKVEAEEDDTWYGRCGRDPATVEFAAEGSTWDEFDGGDVEIATVTRWFDLSPADPAPQEVPFTLETGPRHIDFSLTGRVRMEARQGVVVQPTLTKSAKATLLPKATAMLLNGERVAVKGRETHLLQLAPDGGLLHAYANDRTTPWTRVAGDLRPPVIVVASDKALHLFAVRDDGEVSHRAISPDADPRESGHANGRSLGGSVVSPVLATTAGNRIQLFALSAEGAAFARTALEASDWERIGEGLAGDLNAFTTPRGEVCLVARGRSGDIQHLSWSVEDGTGGGSQWQTIGTAPPGALSAECIDDVVVLAVLSEDETVHAAPWRDYPEPPPRLEWRNLGTMNELISARYSLRSMDGVPDTGSRAAQDG